MVGGVIVGLSFPGERVHVHVADCPHYPKHGRGDECPRPETCCVYTDAKLEDGTVAALKVGDSFWWQGGLCYWTPKENRGKHDARGGVDFDIRMKKIGYSH